MRLLSRVQWYLFLARESMEILDMAFHIAKDVERVTMDTIQNHPLFPILSEKLKELNPAAIQKNPPPVLDSEDSLRDSTLNSLRNFLLGKVTRYAESASAQYAPPPPRTSKELEGLSLEEVQRFQQEQEAAVADANAKREAVMGEAMSTAMAQVDQHLNVDSLHKALSVLDFALTA